MFNKFNNVTLADIAKRADVSINTVSRALKDKPDISEKTKQRIRAISEELGYIGNASASFLRSGISKNIALIIGDVLNPYFAITICHIEKYCRNFGYTVFVFNTEEDAVIERSAIISAANKNVDGIIICPTQKNRDNIDFLISSGIPFVLLGRYFDEVPANYVVNDDFKSGRIVAEHLLNLGHRDILFLNAPKYISSATQRFSGFSRAFSDNGLTYDNSLEFTMSSVSSQNSDELKQIFSEKHFSAIVAFNDALAIESISVLHELGKRVPEDVSVIGFDNIQSSVTIPASLTSVGSVSENASEIAVDILMESISHNSSNPRCVYVDTSIYKRSSTSMLV